VNKEEREYKLLKFTESLDISDYKAMGEPIGIYGLKSGRYYIIKIKEIEELKLIFVLNYDIHKLIYLDMHMFNNFYKENNFSKSFVNSIFEITSFDMAKAYDLTLPQDPMLRREYNKNYNKKYNEYIKVKESIKENDKFNSFLSVENYSDLDKFQRRERETLTEERNTDEGFQHFEMGEYHLATLLKRLESCKILEAQNFKEMLKKHRFSVAIKDYGLTNAEIISGLSHAKKPIEKEIFRAFLKGSKNVNLAIDLYEKYLENGNSIIILGIQFILNKKRRELLMKSPKGREIKDFFVKNQIKFYQENLL
tara:strand:+ start:4272 stop:5198 length:927 start_codon:yes stop_codon:yes gene_type:complete